MSSDIRTSGFDEKLNNDISPNVLARLSRSELCSRLEAQASDLVELRRLMIPFKVENVRLSRSLKQACQQVQEVALSLRTFFADPGRREWFKQQKEDITLCRFFHQLIAWYRRVSDDDNCTVAFYQKIWEYERGEGDLGLPMGGNRKSMDQKSSLDGPPREGSRREGSRSQSPSNEVWRSNSDMPRLSSSRLYDACHVRRQNLRLQEENSRLRQENKSLHRVNTALEQEISGLQKSGTSSSLGAGSQSEVQRPSRKSDRTLAQLAVLDPRWNRLLQDPDQLFSADDVIDETYEQYLSDVLALMHEHNCTFKRGIELSAEDPACETFGTPTSGSGNLSFESSTQQFFREVASPVTGASKTAGV